MAEGRWERALYGSLSGFFLATITLPRDLEDNMVMSHIKILEKCQKNELSPVMTMVAHSGLGFISPALQSWVFDFCQGTMYEYSPCKRINSGNDNNHS